MIDQTGYKNDLFNNIRIVTSQDGPFAISDAINQTLSATKHELRISAPWMGKGFVDRSRNLHLKGISMKCLSRTPEKKDARDRTFQTVESMKAIEKLEGSNTEFKFNSDLHVKMVIVDDKICFVSSFNPTDSGIYYNHEWMCISEDPAFVRRHENYFDELWVNPQNITYQQMKAYYGAKTVDGLPYRKKIAEKIITQFDGNGNSKILKSKLVENVRKILGYDKETIISVCKDLVKDGVLYEPDYMTYGLSCSLTDL
jgi:hypothetical protein